MLNSSPVIVLIWLSKTLGNSFRILSNMKGNDVGVVLLGLRLISWFTLWRVMG